MANLMTCPCRGIMVSSVQHRPLDKSNNTTIKKQHYQLARRQRSIIESAAQIRVAVLVELSAVGLGHGVHLAISLRQGLVGLVLRDLDLSVVVNHLDNHGTAVSGFPASSTDTRSYIVFCNVVFLLKLKFC